MISKRFFNSGLLFAPRKCHKRMNFQLLTEFSQQTSQKIVTTGQENQENSNGAHMNIKKNIDFMNFQAFIDNMKVFLKKK